RAQTGRIANIGLRADNSGGEFRVQPFLQIRNRCAFPFCGCGLSARSGLGFLLSHERYESILPCSCDDVRLGSLPEQLPRSRASPAAALADLFSWAVKRRVPALTGLIAGGKDCAA